MSVLAQIPAWLGRVASYPDIACITPLLPIVGYFFLADATMTDEFNPHSKDKFDEKSSRKANADDIKKMAANYKDNFASWMKLLFTGRLKCSPFSINVTSKIAILLRIF